ncbi:MAG TPA: hypothetical protein VKD65_13940 [Candidatus Angelobacter sp.]|nr:hypothetical protein [Candidatus Angelobacter sp.]
MEEFLKRTWDHLIGRIEGPLSIRIILQPVVSSVIGLLIAVKDARAGRPPFCWTVLTDKLHRRESLKEAWRDISRVFMVAVIIDVIYQIAVLHWIYPLQSLLVAAVLAMVPYAVIRVLANLIISLWLNHRTKDRAVAASRRGMSL